jgi:hypothetical protein
MAILRISPHALAIYRIGRSIRHLIDDLDAWLEELSADRAVTGHEAAQTISALRAGVHCAPKMA